MKWYHALPVFLATCVLAVFLNFIPASNENTKTDLPIISISLSDTNLSEIISNSKDIKYQNNNLAIELNNQSQYFTSVEIKGRGNSTWGLPKSPFQIKFKNKVSLLNMASGKKWILLANFFDKSNLRTDVAFYLEHMLNEEYALEGRFVKLYIDNEYQGLYYLTEKIEIDKHRINLKDDLGIIVELENLHVDKENCYFTKENTCLVVHDLVEDNNEIDAISHFVNDFNALEQAAKEDDYKTVSQLIDVASFAKYFLLSEFTVNPDAYASSFFFYKDGDNDKIHAGPGWDYDYSLGNQTWVWSRTKDYYLPEATRVIEKYSFGGKVFDEVTREYVNLTPDSTISKLLFLLYRIPEFKAETEKIYREQMMGKKGELLDYIRSQANYIHDTAIQDKELWYEADLDLLKKLDPEAKSDEDNILHTNLSSEDAFNLEVNNLLDWVSRRFDHFDYEYGGFKDLSIFLN